MTSTSTLDSKLIDISTRSPGFGGFSASTYSVFSGINALGGIPALPANSDNQGLVFFTKPCLNLSYNNVSNVRKMSYLATADTTSMGCAIRCMLNPPGFDNISDSTYIGDQARSVIIDDKNAFMPISNLLLSMPAPPDIATDVYTSSEGYNKEQISFMDGKPNNYGVYPMTATFANMEGDPITTIFDTWIEYGQRVLDGTLLPFPINIVENRIDYQTRIYRLVLDRTRTFVQRIFATGAAFPTSVPKGAVLGYTHGVHLSPEADQIQINFQCIGAMYDDPILVSEFNYTVASWNADMGTVPNNPNMIKVVGLTSTGIPMKSLLNYKMYPRISNTMELEWWTPVSTYNLVVSIIDSIATNGVNNSSNISSNPNVENATTSLSPWTSSVLPK